MRKVILLLVLLSGFNAAFGCESPFDDVKGMTCEIECILCEDCNFDIKLCDKVKEKFELFKEDYTIASEKRSKAQRAAKELEIKADALKKELDVNPSASHKIIKLIAEARELRRIAYDAAGLASAVYVNFLGEESLKLLESEEFLSEVKKCYSKMGE